MKANVSKRLRACWQSVLVLSMAGLIASCGGAGSSGGSAVNPPPPINTPIGLVTKAELVEVSSMMKGVITASWISSAEDSATAASINYELHLSAGDNDFTPNNNTLKYAGKALSTDVIGLPVNQLFSVKLVAIDKDGKRFISNLKKITTSIADPVSNIPVITIASNNIITPFDPTTQTINISGQIKKPEIGTYIATEKNNGYLGRVVGVTTNSDGSTQLKTVDASLSEVVKNLDLSTSISLSPVRNTSNQTGLISTKTSGTNTIQWTQSGLTLSSETPNIKKPDVNKSLQIGLVAEESKEKVVEKGYGYILRMPKTVTVNSVSSLPIDLVITPESKFELCKYEIINDQNNGKFATMISDKGSINFNPAGIAEGVYLVKLRAYIDEIGDNCNGDNWSSTWSETPEIVFHVANIIQSSFETEAKEFKCNDPNSERAFKCNAKFNITNDVDYTFNPELNINVQFDDNYGVDSIKTADFIINSKPQISQTMTINAELGGILDKQTIGLIKTRRFTKVFNAGPVPVLISGEYWVDMEIEGEAKGTIDVNEIITLGFDELNYGLSYNSLNNSWRVINERKPRFTINVKGDGDAKATVTVALVPRLKVQIYQYPTARLTVRPSLTADTGIHGQIRFNASNEGISKEADYWLTDLTLKGQVDGYFYVALESLKEKVISDYVFPENGKPDDYSSHYPVKIIDSTTFFELPKLTAEVDNTQTLETNSRAMLIPTVSTSTPSPFKNIMGPESYVYLKEFTLPKIISIGGIGYQLDPASNPKTSTVTNGLNKSLKQWISFNKAGEYTFRASGETNLGAFSRVVAPDITIKVTDNNNNNIMDYWEERYALTSKDSDISSADPDGDGVKNYDEWLMGTNPIVADQIGCTAPQVLQDTKCIFITNATLTNDTGNQATVGQKVLFWINGAWDSITKVIFSFTDGIADIVKSVVGGTSIDDKADATFSTAGNQTVTAKFYGTDNQYLGTTSANFNVAAPTKVTTITPLTATLYTNTPFTITGENLPLTAVLSIQDGECDNANATNRSATGFTVMCTVSGVAGEKKLTIKTDVSANNGTVIDESKFVTVSTVPVAIPTGLLPDTGITANQCYKAGSNALVSCTSPEAIALNPHQDGMIGRDVTSPDNSDGKLGFSYSTVGNYPITECVQDKITGLMWEGKPASGTLRGNPAMNSNRAYTNYDSTYGTPAQIAASTNAQAYVNAVNTAGLCGHKDWRLPTVDELQGIVDYGGTSPSIDSAWFPNTAGSYYWTLSPNVGNSDLAWGVNFNNGSVSSSYRNNNFICVRLVRASQSQ